jgi:hypothetical protein
MISQLESTVLASLVMAALIGGLLSVVLQLACQS